MSNKLNAKHVIHVISVFISKTSEMNFKAIQRLFSFNKNYFHKNICFLSTNNVREVETNINGLHSNSKTKKIVSLLREHHFNDIQIDSIFNSIGKYIIEEKDINDELMRETIECWNSCLRPPQLRAKQLDKLNAEDIDYDMSVDFNHVISRIEPKLLLINANAILYRINNIKQLSIIGGSRDLWRVFVYAPNGYYLQSWTDFLKKYHYLNFRVLDWLLDKKDKDKLHPHPLIRNARVMQLPFDTIRCRYLFAKRTGLKTVGISNKLSKREEISKIDLKALLLTSIELYLKLIAPNCSSEEYLALEALLNEMPTEEDEQIIEDMIELTASHNKNFKKRVNHLREDQTTNYQIITPFD